MFSTIFKYELKYWLKQPSIYIYFFLFFLAGLTAMVEWVGTWENHQHRPTSVWMANAPHHINSVFDLLQKLILLLLPTVIGMSVYRDFKNKIHTLLYSFPFRKSDYLFAKFASAYLVLCFIVSGAGIGLFVGTQLRNANESMLLPFDWAAYLQPYLVYVLPNLLLFGAIVFAIVIFSRNIYASFIAIIVLLFFQGVLGSVLGGLESEFLASIIEPMGKWAAGYETKYWTVAEWNANLLPVGKVVIYNRLLWLGVASLVFGWAYRRFAFSQQASDAFPASVAFFTPLKSFYASDAGKASTVRSFGQIIKVNLPKVDFNFSPKQDIKTIWQLSNFDFFYIIKNSMFLCIVIAGLGFVLFQQMQTNPIFGFKILPVTWNLLLVPSLVFGGVILLLTFLFAGMLVHRSRLAQMNQLLDMTPISNWVLLLSKFVALVKMQAILLSFIMIGGLFTQIYNGFYDFKIGLYLFDLYGLTLISFVIWAFVALFIQTLFTNPFLGTILLLLGSMGIAGLPDMGIDHIVFQYNIAPRTEYSDMDGYGTTLAPFLLYKIYWTLFGVFLLFGAYCWWIRGLPHSFGERFQIALSRMCGKVGFGMGFLFISFLIMGFKIYQNDSIEGNRIATNEEEELWMVNSERKYKQYEKTPQPRIHATKLNIDIFPEKRNYRAAGEYLAVNESNAAMDTILIHYNFNEQTGYDFERLIQLISKDTFHRFDIWKLEKPLAIGDTLKMNFTTQNKPNSTFKYNTRIKGNGTYFTDLVFPGFGYQGFELTDNNKRVKHGLPKRDNAKAHPTDSTALFNNYGSKDTDWIHFEAVMSTSADQTAIAPGYLQDQWTENGRNYFHYKMDDKIKDYYGFNSGRFEVLRDKWQNVDLEIYYHKSHDYSLENMMRGMKGALEFNAENFSPYQHKQARIIEFPKTYGTFATTFANSVPFSETRFIASYDPENENSIDMSFFVAAHEIAHQWWGNQLIPADVLGARMLTESMAEYSALKALEKEYGKRQMRNFLQVDLEAYLRGRGKDSRKEQHLLCSHPSQDFVNYRKGALVMYALSDYIGEENFHAAIKEYLEKVKFQSAPYTTSYEMLDYLKAATPDSLQYLIHDMFETITLYDNQIKSVKTTELPDGKYEVELNFLVSKYRSTGRGVRSYANENGDSLIYQNEHLLQPIQSLPLADYIEIGIFGQVEIDGKRKEKLLYLEKHKITEINNSVKIIVREKPVKVGVDPFGKLIDDSGWDNRREI